MWIILNISDKFSIILYSLCFYCMFCSLLMGSWWWQCNLPFHILVRHESWGAELPSSSSGHKHLCHPSSSIKITISFSTWEWFLNDLPASAIQQQTKRHYPRPPTTFWLIEPDQQLLSAELLVPLVEVTALSSVALGLLPRKGKAHLDVEVCSRQLSWVLDCLNETSGLLCCHWRPHHLCCCLWSWSSSLLSFFIISPSMPVEGISTFVLQFCTLNEANSFCTSQSFSSAHWWMWRLSCITKDWFFHMLAWEAY